MRWGWGTLLLTYPRPGGEEWWLGSVKVCLLNSVQMSGGSKRHTGRGEPVRWEGAGCAQAQHYWVTHCVSEKIMGGASLTHPIGSRAPECREHDGYAHRLLWHCPSQEPCVLNKHERIQPVSPLKLRLYRSPCITDGETEAQREAVSCPGSDSESVAELGWN